MDKDSLILFNFTRSAHKSLKWEEEDEFEYHHQMYDVIHTQFQGDTVYLWCWKDQDETYLKSQLSQQLRHLLSGTPQGKTDSTRLISFFKNLYFVDRNDWRINKMSVTIERSPAPSDLFSSLSFPPLTPPPEWVAV